MNIKPALRGEKGTLCVASEHDTTQATVVGAIPYEARPCRIKALRMRDPFTVHTLEGVMRGKAGDYLVQGMEGELYPCAAAIFERKYKPAEDSSPKVEDKCSCGSRKGHSGLCDY